MIDFQWQQKSHFEDGLQLKYDFYATGPVFLIKAAIILLFALCAHLLVYPHFQRPKLLIVVNFHYYNCKSLMVPIFQVVKLKIDTLEFSFHILLGLRFYLKSRYCKKCGLHKENGENMKLY